MQDLLKSNKNMGPTLHAELGAFYIAATYVAQQCEELVFEMPWQQWSRSRATMLHFMYTA